MADIKNSKLLNYILNHAKESAPQPGDLTASRYLLSLLEVYSGETSYKPDAEEKRALKAVLQKYLPHSEENLAGLRRFLSDWIAQNQSTRSETVSMQILMYKARERSRQNKKEEVDAQDLLEQIFESPDASIQACIAFDTEGEKSTAGKEPAQPAQDGEKSENEIFELFRRGGAAAPGKAGRPEREDRPEKKEELPEEKKDAPPKQYAKDMICTLTNRAKKLQEDIRKEVFGQDKAVSVFSSGYFQAEMTEITDTKRVKPLATYLFAGPPGVGKTFLAETGAEKLKLPFRRFDMSEYSEREAVYKLIGSTKTWVGAEEGLLTGFVKENPKCVILFDEIEKANINVIYLFLQILDAGRAKDNHTLKEVSFRDTILIFTTNAGKQLYEGSDLADFSGITRKVVLKALERDVNAHTGLPFFPPAICSRFASGNVVMFNHISAHNLRRIARKELLKNASNFEDAFRIQIDVDERVHTALLFAEGGQADARMIKSRAKTFLNDELFELFRLLGTDREENPTKDLETISIGVDLPQSGRIRDLFFCEDHPEVLLVASERTAEICGKSCDSVSFVLAQDTPAVKKALQEKDVSFALIDFAYGRRGGSTWLNVEDAESAARDQFWFLRENYGSLPIYLVLSEGESMSEEEQMSFLRMGVRGILSVNGDADEAFSETIRSIVAEAHQQRKMIELARENKVLTFETFQTISEDGKRAEIRMFDFETEVAVEAEDGQNLLTNRSRPTERFSQVIGAKEAIKELRFFVDYLKNPKRYWGSKLSAPKGVLLYGPPGTGKTLLAKATAGESNVTFISAEGNQFLKKYAGEGPEAVGALFRTARKYAPSIVFIDEIDAIARTRTGEDTAGRHEILNKLLSEMDGFKNDFTRPVFVLAATNFGGNKNDPDSLDPAFLRRFDRSILVDLPDRDGRTEFLRMRMAENPALELSEELIRNIAVRSTGMSLAELSSVIELALRSAIRGGSMKVTDEIFEEAFETFTNGEMKDWDSAQLERVARHEAGHAFLNWHSGETPSYMTIVARGNHGGYMQHDDQERKAIYTRQELLARLRTTLGGRAAEIVYYGPEDGVSTGASGDLQHATAIARSYLCSFGMDDDFGLSYIAPVSASRDMSPEVTAAVNRLLKREMRSAIDIVEANRASVDALVEQLLVKNHLTGPEIRQILEGR